MGLGGIPRRAKPGTRHSPHPPASTPCIYRRGSTGPTQAASISSTHGLELLTYLQSLTYLQRSRAAGVRTGRHLHGCYTGAPEAGAFPAAIGCLRAQTLAWPWASELGIEGTYAACRDCRLQVAQRGAHAVEHLLGSVQPVPLSAPGDP